MNNLPYPSMTDSEDPKLMRRYLFRLVEALNAMMSGSERTENQQTATEQDASLRANLGGSSVFVDKSAKALTIASDYVLKIGSTAVSESQLQELLALLDQQ